MENTQRPRDLILAKAFDMKIKYTKASTVIYTKRKTCLCDKYHNKAIEGT